MPKCKLTVEIKISWWVRWLYLPSLSLVTMICKQFDLESEPDLDFTMSVIKRGTKIKVK